MATDTVIQSARSSFFIAADFEKEKNNLLYNYYIDVMENIFGL